MLMNTLTDSIEKPGTFSNGASRPNYTKSWGQNPLKNRQEGGSLKLSILLDDDIPTNIRSASVNLDAVRNYLQHGNAVLSIEDYAWLNLYEQALSANPDAPVKNTLDELILTSTFTSTVPVLRFVGLQDFPTQIKEYLHALYASEQDEDALYEIAEAIVEWLTDNSDEYQTRLAVEFKNMPLVASRILIVSLRNAETHINSENLLYAISSFLESTDKLLAQSSAACLLTCGGHLGKNIVETALLENNLPHSRLIQGIIRLLN